MYRKTLALLLLLSPVVSYAGFFDSRSELKCGDDNAIAAAKAWIYDEGLGYLQQAYLRDADGFFDIPQSQYEQQLRAIPVNFSDVITEPAASEKENIRSCSATVSMDIPDPLFKVMSALPESLYFITRDEAKIINTRLIWKQVSYNIQLADNGNDIVFTPSQKTNYLSWSIYDMAKMAVSGDELIKRKNDSLIDKAAKKFERQDRQLNDVWNALPASSRAALKKEQRAWVTKKEQQCGKLSDAKSDAVPVAQRISIYQCQGEMTIVRTGYLDGNELPDRS